VIDGTSRWPADRVAATTTARARTSAVLNARERCTVRPRLQTNAKHPPPPVAGPDEPDRVSDAARLAGVERRAGVGHPGWPVIHRAHRDRRQHARRGRRVQQLQAPVAHQHVYRFAGRVRPHGWRGRVAV